MFGDRLTPDHNDIDGFLTPSTIQLSRSIATEPSPPPLIPSELGPYSRGEDEGFQEITGLNTRQIYKSRSLNPLGRIQ